MISFGGQSFYSFMHLEEQNNEQDHCRGLGECKGVMKTIPSNLGSDDIVFINCAVFVVILSVTRLPPLWLQYVCVYANDVCLCAC